MSSLLGIDLGLRTGFALYDSNGSLIWYRSTHFPSKGKLKSASYNIIKEIPDLSRIVLEGGGELAWVWIKEASKQKIFLKQISAQTWREALLLPRESRSGNKAKDSALRLAQEIIAASKAPNPKTKLRHDCAEAILIGYWGVMDAGWLKAQFRPA